jgi:predicted DCC family thiol-disulfide oxidoreductase YuxK
LGDGVSETTLLIDAHCVMCNGLANYLRSRQRSEKALIIHGIQSPEGQALIATFPKRLQSLDTLYVVRKGRAHVRSAGAIRLLLTMRWYYAVLFPFAWLVPLPLRDGVYWVVSKLRHRFGRTDD